MGSSAAHRGEDLQIRCRLSAQGLLHPLTRLVKHSPNNLPAPLELAPPDLLQLLLKAQFQLLHLLGLQALQVRQRALQTLLHLTGNGRLPLHHVQAHAGHRLQQRCLQVRQRRVPPRVR
jgi:hypothetical protein